MSNVFHHSTTDFIINDGNHKVNLFPQLPVQVWEVYITPEKLKYCFILTKHTQILTQKLNGN